MYAIVEPLIYKIIHPYRKTCTWCNSLYYGIDVDRVLRCNNSRSFSDLVSSQDKRRGFHVRGWNTRGTIELRYHEVTSDFKTIINWIKFNLGLFEFAEKHTLKEIEQFSKDLKLIRGNEKRLKFALKTVFKGNTKISNFYLNRFFDMEDITDYEECDDCW